MRFSLCGFCPCSVDTCVHARTCACVCFFFFRIAAKTQDEKMMLGLQHPYVFHWGGAERDNDEGNEKEGICN